MSKKEFISNVTGEEWQKHHSHKWPKVIGQIGTVLEDVVSEGKNNTTVTLKGGSKVIIDDIRGRIKPQYRVTDRQGKVWFISSLNMQIEVDNEIEANISDHKYRGGVRHDGSKAKDGRYEITKTTQEEIEELRKKK